jgi:hypothetical protein
VLAELAGPDGRTPPLLWSYRCQVVLSSPRPVSECVQRLAAVTTYRGASEWYRHEWALGRPDPRFQGDVDQVRVRLTRFGNRRAAPVLDARPEAAPGGGTALSGWVGDDDSVAAAIVFLPRGVAW